jgi:hypothetical protein
MIAPTCHIKIGEIVVQIFCENEPIFECLRESLFLESEEKFKKTESDFSLIIRNGSSTSREKFFFLKSYPWDSKDTFYFKSETELMFAKGEDLDVVGILNYPQKNGEIFIFKEEPTFENARIVCFTLLKEAGKIFGFFPFHAAALEKNGKVVLIPAPGGTGKTALTLQLLEDSFSFISDDTVFLHAPHGKRLSVIGFPGKPKVDSGHLALFPHLKTLSENMEDPAGRWYIDLNQNPDDWMKQEGSIDLIIFLVRGRSFFCRAAPEEALKRLILGLILPDSNPKFFQSYFYHILTLADSRNSYFLGNDSLKALSFKIENLLKE